MSQREELSLATPGGSSDRIEASRDFNFPYPQAYQIQIDLMRKVFESIEQGKVGIFESPTGTGKSLSLICAAFTWLRQNAERATRGSTIRSTSSMQEPDWVLQHELDRQRKAREQKDLELKDRIAAARQRQAQLKNDYKLGRLDAENIKPKRPRLAKDAASDSEDDLLQEDDDNVSGRRAVQMATYSNQAVSHAHCDHDSNLSPAVRALMQQYEQNKASRLGPEDEVEPETLPRIIYVSRTHSQLSQFVSELRKTTFGQTANSLEGLHQAPIRTVSLGSRRQMCINDDVQRLGRTRGSEAMNERCLELLKAKAGQKRCSALPPFDQAGRAQILEFRDIAMADVGDIEDLVQLGKSTNTCPYFAARSSAKQAELVTLPYNLLLQKDARHSLGISLKDCVILVDEAHNLIDTILSTHSVTITSRQIEQATKQIQTYLDRFSLRLRGSNEQNLRKTRSLLVGMTNFIQRWADRATASSKTGKIEEIMSASDFVTKMSGSLDQINLITLETWLKETHIARKVSGYADRQGKKNHVEASLKPTQKRGRSNHVSRTTVTHHSEESESSTESTNSVSAMHMIETFILSLANRTEDGRVMLCRQQYGEDSIVQIKYQLLNPSHVFRSVVEEARSVILAGGTMEPISDFQQQLVPFLDASRLVTFSCGHVIPPSNLMATVLPYSPKGLPFEFKFDRRDNTELLDELGRTLVNLCNVIPHGLVVFLPSYSFLDNIFRRWKDAASGDLMKRIASKKRVFSEPKTTMEVDKVLHEYAAEIDAIGASGTGGGAILFAVVGAKLSEGINFSDSLARGVVMVGMPFANVQSPELAERMKYVRELGKQQSAPSPQDPGSELYLNLCMKAVNQSIGRAVRHQNDYAALILLDRRYSRPDIRQRLPGWIRDQVQVADKFGTAIQQAATFFKNKKKC